MFTGIIEEVGTIKAWNKAKISGTITIEAKKVLEDTKIGDSIAVNGICLTVVTMQKNFFTADVMIETIKRSSFSNIKIGDKVNLERAMPIYGRFGGHIVSGHIDGTGHITSIVKEEIALIMTIQTSKDILRYVVEKGSITIDGISLTVVSVNEDSFTVSLIPHTLKETILFQKKVFDMVNLETDVIGKYVEKMLVPFKNENQKNSNITMDYLLENGF